MKGGRVPELGVYVRRYECAHDSYLTSSLDSKRIPCASVPYAMVNLGVVTKYSDLLINKNPLNYSATVAFHGVCVQGNISKYYNILELVQRRLNPDFVTGDVINHIEYLRTLTLTV